MNWKMPLACASCLLSGAGVAWMFMPRLAPAEVIARSEPSPAPRAASERALSNQTATQAKLMRAIVREEVAGAVEQGVARAAADTKASAAAEAPEAVAVDEPPAPTPSYTKAVTYVDDRIARGVWTESERDEMSNALGSMSQQERMEAHGTCHPSGQSGQAQGRAARTPLLRGSPKRAERP